MFEVINSTNEVILRTTDRELAELVMYACCLARNQMHKVLDYGKESSKVKGRRVLEDFS
jgi:hypothetical protein